MHLAIVAVALALLACASERVPDREFDTLWRAYRSLPDERSLAIARELGGNLWVAGMAGGQPTLEAAETEALAACQKQRSRKRLQVPCRLYAVGDDVLWRFE